MVVVVGVDGVGGGKIAVELVVDFVSLRSRLFVSCRFVSRFESIRFLFRSV